MSSLYFQECDLSLISEASTFCQCSKKKKKRNKLFSKIMHDYYLVIQISSNANFIGMIHIASFDQVIYDILTHYCNTREILLLQPQQEVIYSAKPLDRCP